MPETCWILPRGSSVRSSAGRSAWPLLTVNYFTYYDLHSSPLREACLTVSECSDCLSESKYCQTCGEATSGIIEQNLLDFLPAVESELECKAGCSCSQYTYFSQEDPQVPDLCFLLTDLISPLTNCPHCLTGPLDCSLARPAYSWTTRQSDSNTTADIIILSCLSV